MRLTASQTEIISQAERQNFFADASAWLFGSRVDDGRRGGDIDLYIESARESTRMSGCVAKLLSKTTWICTLTRAPLAGRHQQGHYVVGLPANIPYL